MTDLAVRGPGPTTSRAGRSRAGGTAPTRVTVGGAPSAANHTLLLGTFLASECMFFLALIAAHLHYPDTDGVAPPLRHVLDWRGALFSTVLLVVSSGTMEAAVRARGRGDGTRSFAWLGATFALGTVFLVRQGREFASVAARGLGFTTDLAGSSFYLLTGFHGAHLAAGLLWILSLLVVSRTRYRAKAGGAGLEMASLYWHFVDGVWVVLFTLLYAVPAATP